MLDRVVGLGRVPDAARAGLSIVHARAAFPAEPVTIAAAWPVVAWKALTGTVPADLLPIDLAGLRALAPDDRRRLVDTLRTYFGTGSIKQTADQLFCHRNTIVKRLDRFEDLVGLDVGVPQQAALALLALTAADPE